MNTLIEDTLKELLNDSLPPTLYQAASYSLDGGKFLRPLLTLATVSAFDEPIEKALLPACAIELVHTYSLIHDDLPCMDDDDYRRGKPSLHKAFPESIAVLTGDFFLTYAFEIIAKAPLLSFEEKNKLTLILAKRSGSEGMIGGQIMDIEGKIEVDSLHEMHLKKTAALFTAALEFGGVIAKQDLKPLQQIGQNLGLAYQMKDDLQDSEQDEISSVTFLGYERTKELAEMFYNRALDGISSLKTSSNQLTAFIEDLK